MAAPKARSQPRSQAKSRGGRPNSLIKRLEERVDELEHRVATLESAAAGPAPRRRTQRFARGEADAGQAQMLAARLLMSGATHDETARILRDELGVEDADELVEAQASESA